MGQRERDALARRHGERPHGVHILAVEFDSRPEHEEVGTGHGRQRGLVEMTDPGNAPPVIEPNCKIDAELDPPPVTDHDTDEIGTAITRRHEVYERCSTFRRQEGRFQDERSVAITPGGSRLSIPGPDAPSAVFGRPQQRREAGFRVEAWKAQPVDRPLG